MILLQEIKIIENGLFSYPAKGRLKATCPVGLPWEASQMEPIDVLFRIKLTSLYS